MIPPRLVCKKKRNRLTGKFSYQVWSAIKFRPVQDDYVLRIPRPILREAGWHKGSRVSVSVKGRALILGDGATRSRKTKDPRCHQFGFTSFPSRGSWDKCGWGIRAYAAKAP